MKAAMLHLVTAAATFAGAQVWLALGETAPALAGLAFSIAWLVVAISRLKAPARHSHTADVSQTQRLERILAVSVDRKR